LNAPPNAPHILLIRLSSLGDIVLSTAALAPLRAAGYAVSVVTKSEFASLWKGHPDIREVYAYDKKIGETEARQEFLQWARSKNFAFVLDLQNSWRTWSWRWALRGMAPVYVLGKPRLREWLVLVFRLGKFFGFGRGGRARRFRRLAEHALAVRGQFAMDSGSLTRLHISDEEKAAVKSLLPAGDFVVLLPGGAWKSKEWPYFSELAGLLARKAPVVVLGGANDNICESVAASARSVNKESRSLHGKTSLRESMAVLAHARWVIGNDTGMVHVAEALGKDVTMIEGPTHPQMGFSVYRERSLVLGLKLACRPCSKSGRICMRFGTRHCLYGLAVSDVTSRLRERGYPC
jgi:ADP-heptose:LPS heptosyltransferase